MAVIGLVGLVALNGGFSDSDGRLPSNTNTLALSTTPAMLDAVEQSSIPHGFVGGVPVTANRQWTPVEREFDGVTMVLVPVGCFDMGNDDGQSDEQPVHRQCFEEPFWIDKYEVTNIQFSQFQGQARREGIWQGDSQPRENVTWFEAGDFCDIRDARLPTEREWEYAARGADNLNYPWGNTWSENNAIWSANSDRKTARVGSRPEGASWVGALDLSGNVWEWVSSTYLPYPYDATDGREDPDRADITRGLRGGSWFSDSSVLLHTSYRFGSLPIGSGLYVGFRCSRDYQDGDLSNP